MKDTKTTAVCDLCLIPTCGCHYIRVCEPCYLHKFKGPNSDDDEDDDEENDVNAPSISVSKPPSAKRLRVDSVINL